MAGIGFELKRLFNKEGIISSIFAGLYAAVVTIGPTIMVIIAINLMHFILPYVNIAWKQREVLSSTILYVFIFSLIISSPINIILSRYTADKIYMEDYESILPALDMGNLILAGLTALTGVPFGIVMYVKGGFSTGYILVSYLFYSGLVFTFYSMTFVTILKEYRKITYSFLFSLLIGILFSYGAVYWWKISVVNAILGGMAISFNLIAMFLMSRLRRTFKDHNGNNREILLYFKKHWMLFLANALYTLGIYSHNFIFWFFSQYQVVVANVFWSAPVYDFVTYLSMFSNLCILVVFVVNVETKFHMAYKTYCESVIGAAGKDILKAKNKMIEVLRRELLYIIQLQLIVNICVFILVIAFASELGITGRILAMYPVMTVAYMIIYLLQCLMIFQFYLDDAPGALLAGALFWLGAVAGSFLSVRFTVTFAGCGVLFGAFLGFSAAFFRIRHKLIHLDEHIYCRGNIAAIRVNRRLAKKKNEKQEKVVVYSFSKQ
ncbi:MAG: exopolysaccharide Pel transporter PelG [Lachnospiraceae bacterium]|nr:exopolysaccharide Pel transporter PelG [Lachnospiraceae bacterium]